MLNTSEAFGCATYVARFPVSGGESVKVVVFWLVSVCYSSLLFL